MPPQKELQFFNNDSLYAQGLTAYIEQFKNRAVGQICGEASPQYMCSQQASRRISETCRQTRLIAILRDPVKRASSHYDMTSRRGRTSQSFSDAVADRLKCPVGSFDEPSIDEDYLILGLYGLQLERYRQHHANGRLHVVFLEELQSNPQYELQRLGNYLGVEEPLASTKFPHAHKGGTARFNRIDRFVSRSALVRSVARLFLTAEQRQALRFKYETRYNVRVSERNTLADSRLEMQLREYFEDDTAKLESMLGRQVPWNSAKDDIR